MADHEPSKSIWNRRNALSSIWSRGCAGINREDPALHMPAYSRSLRMRGLQRRLDAALYRNSGGMMLAGSFSGAKYGPTAHNGTLVIQSCSR